MFIAFKLKVYVGKKVIFFKKCQVASIRVNPQACFKRCFLNKLFWMPRQDPKKQTDLMVFLCFLAFAGIPV